MRTASVWRGRSGRDGRHLAGFGFGQTMRSCDASLHGIPPSDWQAEPCLVTPDTLLVRRWALTGPLTVQRIKRTVKRVCQIHAKWQREKGEDGSAALVFHAMSSKAKNQVGLQISHGCVQ